MTRLRCKNDVRYVSKSGRRPIEATTLNGHSDLKKIAVRFSQFRVSDLTCALVNRSEFGTIDLAEGGTRNFIEE